MITSCPDLSAIVRRFVTVIAGAIAVSACAGPVAPSALPPASQAATGFGPLAERAPLVTTKRVVTSSPLENGTFVLSLRTGDGAAGVVSGTYTGNATSASSGNSTASLDMHITQTSGSGALVTAISGEGSGAFVTDGTFTLTVTLSLAATKQSVKATFRGTAQTSCSASERIVVTQHGTASTPKFVDLVIDLQHEIGFAGCSA